MDNNERYLCQVDCSSNRPTSLDIVFDDSTDYLRHVTLPSSSSTAVVAALAATSVGCRWLLAGWFASSLHHHITELTS